MDRINTSINSAETRIKSLTDLRINYETRIDSLFARNYITVAKRVEQQIVNADQQINDLNLTINENYPCMNKYKRDNNFTIYPLEKLYRQNEKNCTRNEIFEKVDDE